MSGNLEWGPVSNGGTVYALKFSDGAVKVGKTAHLRQRLDRLVSDSRRAFDAHLVDWYFTHVHATYSATEDFAIAAAEKAMTSESRRLEPEWFLDIDFEVLLGLLAELDPTSSYNAARAERAAA